MTMFKLEYFCYCGSLRTGSLIIAYLTLVRDILVTLASTIILALKDSALAAGLDRVMIPVFGILLVIGIVNVIFATVLLVGILKYKNVYLKTYFIFNVMQMVVAILLVLTLCITSGLPGIIPLCLVLLGFHIYYLLIIRSYYLKMDDPSNKPAIFDTFNSPLASEFVVDYIPEEKGSSTNYAMS